MMGRLNWGLVGHEHENTATGWICSASVVQRLAATSIRSTDLSPVRSLGLKMGWNQMTISEFRSWTDAAY